VDALFALSPAIRSVAFGRGGSVISRMRPHLNGASSRESDRYEELLVNPTLLDLTRRRGEIDCSGLEFLVIGYGAFRQLVLPVGDGHVSIAVERHADAASLVPRVRSVLRSHGLAAPAAP
jgi:hypothetical protein